MLGKNENSRATKMTGFRGLEFGWLLNLTIEWLYTHFKPTQMCSHFVASSTICVSHFLWVMREIGNFCSVRIGPVSLNEPVGDLAPSRADLSWQQPPHTEPNAALPPASASRRRSHGN